ncbi:uncharacterized protein PAC_01362 [Phialocephala subalpina]|uniref:Uncharacterized protein n=1 Tax=Phialocephala subalpina TaxID=576137 RepID=A0A1L7WFE2_9HELO|nr:uncharacterized protein PAC_01362 [Phialocephala subalpina]
MDNSKRKKGFTPEQREQMRAAKLNRKADVAAEYEQPETKRLITSATGQRNGNNDFVASLHCPPAAEATKPKRQRLFKKSRTVRKAIQETKWVCRSEHYKGEAAERRAEALLSLGYYRKEVDVWMCRIRRRCLGEKEHVQEYKTVETYHVDENGNEVAEAELEVEEEMGGTEMMFDNPRPGPSTITETPEDTTDWDASWDEMMSGYSTLKMGE